MLSLLQVFNSYFGFFLIFGIILLTSSENITNNNCESIENNTTLSVTFSTCNEIIRNEKLKGTLRLPNNTIPLQYNLNFDFGADIDTETFSGHVILKVRINKTTNSIVMNAKNLTDFMINVTELYNNDHPNSDYIVPNIEFIIDNEKNFLIIFTKNHEYKFEKDNFYLISIKYTGLVNRDGDARGVFVTTSDKTNKTIMASFLEPVQAELLFPCFDEPSFKARFKIQLIYTSNYSAISNTQIESEYVSGDSELSTKITQFKESPLMSTYLVAFAIHPNYLSESIELNNITYSVYYNIPDDQQRAIISVKKISQIITKLEEYFDVPYQLPKIDTIGVPKVIGLAMENWGLIILNEQYSLLTLTCTSYNNYYNGLIITHELIHQWFGNLVSPSWWSYAWLNEGFATYFSHIFSIELFPECNMSTSYSGLLMAVTKEDYKENRPLSTYIEGEEQIFNVFDPISYNRAGLIIGMWANCLQKEVFRIGVQKYLKKLQFSTATEDNLFESLEEAALENNVTLFKNHSVDLIRFFRIWSNNRNLPLLNVFRNYETNEIILKQTQTDTKNSDLWYIPINFVTKSHPNFEDTRFTFIMNATDESVILNPNKDLNFNLTENDWLLVNKQGVGTYSVNYDKRNWLLLAKALKENPDNIDVISRTYILISVFENFNSVKFNENFDIEVALEIMSYLEFERNLTVWNFIEFYLSEILQIQYIRVTEIWKKFFSRQFKWLFNEVLMKYSVIFDDPISSNVQRSLKKIICLTKSEECLKHYYYVLTKMFLYDSDEELNLVDWIVNIDCGGILLTNKNEKNEIIKMAVESSTNSEFYFWIYQTICTNDTEYAAQVIELIFDHLYYTNTTIEHTNDLYALLSSYFYNDFSDSWNLVINGIEKHFDILMTNEVQFENLLKDTNSMVFETDIWNKLNKIVKRFKKESTLNNDFEWPAKEITSLKFKKHEKQAIDWFRTYFKNLDDDNIL